MSNTETDHKATDKPEWAKTNAEIRGEINGRSPKRKLVIFAIVIVLVAVVLVAVKPKGSAAPLAEDSQTATVSAKYLAPAELSTLTAKTLRRQIKVTGTVQPLSTAQIPALVSARVERVNVRAGDTVTKGQELITMDVESLTIQLEQQLNSTNATRTQLALAESQLKRTQELKDKGIAPSSTLEEAQSNVKALKANLTAQESQIKAAQYSLRNATITAPISGIVSARNVEPGQFVAVGTPLMEVVNLTTMELKANIATTASALIREGLKVNVSVEGLKDQFTGTISRISPVTNAGTRTIPVYIRIENNQQALRGGMFATGKITLIKKENAIGIPNLSIQSDTENEYFVFKIANNTVVRQTVELGDTWEDGQVRDVLKGLVAGDIIVNLPLIGLKENDTVNIVGG